MIAMMRKAAMVLALITIMVPMLALTYVGEVSAWTRCEAKCNAKAAKCVGYCAKPAIECVAELGNDQCLFLQEVIECYEPNFCSPYMGTSCIENCAYNQMTCLIEDCGICDG